MKDELLNNSNINVIITNILGEFLEIRRKIMDNIIITMPAAKLREMSRAVLAGNWKVMFLGAFIYFIFSEVIGLILDGFFLSVQSIELIEGMVTEVQLEYASNIYGFFVNGPLLCGYIMFLLAYFRKHTVDYALTFEGFSMFGKAFCLYLLYSIKIFLWSLLFVIPGIIAAFRYSQAFYLRVDHPEWSASDCIKESCRLMNGNKMKFFSLNLSFIGWYILASLPLNLVSIELHQGLMVYSFRVLLTMIVSIPTIFVDLYVSISKTVFYEIITGNLVVERNESYFE